MLASLLARFVRIPLVVFEIVLGVLIGPSILGWVQPNEFTSKLAEFGLAMLFFLAGNEIDFERIRGRALNRSIVGWLISLVAGVVIGILHRALGGGRRLHRRRADQHRARHPDAGAAGRR